MVSKSSDRDSSEFGDSLVARLSGCNPGTSEDDVRSFLTGVEIDDINVAGTSVTLKCKNLKSVNAILTFDEKDMNGKIVTVRRCPGDTPLEAEKGALRVGNWPWRITEEEMQNFFEAYNVVPGTVKFHMNEEGRRSGQAAMLFGTEEDAERAYTELQGQDLNGRQARLFDLELEEYNDFENWDPNARDRRCGDSVNEDNVDKCVKLRGLPWAAGKPQLIQFFEGFNVKKKNISIDIQGGRCSGFAIVELENEEEAARAIDELDRKEINGRWIGLSAAEVR